MEEEEKKEEKKKRKRRELSKQGRRVWNGGSEWRLRDVTRRQIQRMRNDVWKEKRVRGRANGKSKDGLSYSFHSFVVEGKDLEREEGKLC